MERKEKGNQDIEAAISPEKTAEWKKEALLLITSIREIEERVFSRLGKDLDEHLTEEIRERIRERVLTELQRDDSELLDRFKRTITREIVYRILKEEKFKRKKKAPEEEKFPRFNIQFRIQHMILFTSVILLILTGLPLKFPNFEPLAGLVYLLGGIENSRILHRVGASLLIFVAIYHTFYTIFHREGRRDFFLLIPMPKDVLDFMKNVLYFLGLSGEKPKFDRFSYIEKFDYWAVYWGCVIMIGTGALLWFQDLALRVLPKFVLDISKEAHSDEALLATLAIVIWHFYNVHFNPDRFPMSWTWWTGTITKHEMEEHHSLEYEEIMKARESTPKKGSE